MLGIFLFGAPLGGLRNETLLSIAKGRRNLRLITDLMEDSTILEALVRNFKANSSCGHLRHQIVSFHETKETRITTVR